MVSETNTTGLPWEKRQISQCKASGRNEQSRTWRLQSRMWLPSTESPSLEGRKNYKM